MYKFSYFHQAKISTSNIKSLRVIVKKIFNFEKKTDMVSLFKKDLSTFFTSLTGYIVITVFLLINSLFLFVFPGQYNIFDAGYATLDTLFILAPWIFLFLVPAITMRTFSEEKRNGTLEFLYTKPLRDRQIIFAKYLAAVSLVLLSLIPSFVFYFTVYKLGNPPGNIDQGGTWGAYTGLFFLGATYVSIGLFSSSLTDNQIIAFLLAVVLCFFMYTGFDSLGSLMDDLEFFVINLGINEHYQSISRGVLDSRDIIYFISVNLLFLTATRLKLESRKW
jgi:ABC-2 type transport system permease protein